MANTVTLNYSLVNWEAEIEISSRKTVNNDDLVKQMYGKYREVCSNKDAKKDEIYLLLFLTWFLKEHISGFVPRKTDKNHLGMQMAPVYIIELPKHVILFNGGTHLSELKEPLVARSNVIEDGKLMISLILTIKSFKIKEFPEQLLIRWLAKNPGVMTSNLYLESSFKQEVDEYEKGNKEKRMGFFSKLLPSTSKETTDNKIEDFLKK
ncbi:matrix protein [Soybean blotchy mosaic virus]|nr:matrix protein [Soybean blotchy mosaic virus]UUC10120.1 matrix protein [Soybean blotchy mosaic virus]